MLKGAFNIEDIVAPDSDYVSNHNEMIDEQLQQK